MLESLSSHWKDSRPVEGLTTAQIQNKAEFLLLTPRAVALQFYNELDMDDVLMLITRAIAFASLGGYYWWYYHQYMGPKATGYKKFLSASLGLD